MTPERVGGPEPAVDGRPDIRGQNGAELRGRKAVRDAKTPYAQEVGLDLPVPGLDLLPGPFFYGRLFRSACDDFLDDFQPITLVRNEKPGQLQMESFAAAAAQPAQAIHFLFASPVERFPLASVVVLQQALTHRARHSLRPRYMKQPSLLFIRVCVCDKLTMSLMVGPRDALLLIELANPGSFLHPPVKCYWSVYPAMSTQANPVAQGHLVPAHALGVKPSTAYTTV